MTLDLLHSVSRLRQRAARLFQQWQVAVRLRREEEARRREKRDEESWQAFEDIRGRVVSKGLRIGEVIRIRQHATTGTKGWVRWTDTGETTAFWIWHKHLTRGQLLAMRGHERDGQHHAERVFEIDEMDPPLPWGTYKGWLDHQARQRKAK